MDKEAELLIHVPIDNEDELPSEEEQRALSLDKLLIIQLKNELMDILEQEFF